MKMLAIRMKTRRQELGITQSELAMRLDTDQKQISKYENDKQDPTAGVLVRLAQELDTTTDWLLGLTDYTERRVEGDLTEKEMTLVGLYREVKPEMRQKVLEFFQAMRVS